jgi:putative aldouronate transport system permease protein
VGLKNFAFFFKSPRAWQVTSNTLKLNVLFMLVGIVVALLFSLMFNEIRSRKFMKVTQSMFLFPNFLSWVVISYILYSFLASNNGIINNLLLNLGMEKINWYSSPEYWPGILVLLKTWKETGMSTIIYLAAISGFDTRLYEAAYIDGASRFQNAIYITLPMLLPTVCILALLGLGKMFRADFGMIYSLIRDNGVLYKTTDVIDTYTFRALRKTGDPSQAMAVGLYQSVMGFILVFTTNWLTRKYFKEGALF